MFCQLKSYFFIFKQYSQVCGNVFLACGIKICGNCKRYFLTPKKNVTYCDRIAEDALTCKDIGNKEYQKSLSGLSSIVILFIGCASCSKRFV